MSHDQLEKQVSSRGSSDDSNCLRTTAQQAELQFDRGAYERVVRFAMFRQILPAYLVSFALAAGVIMLAFAMTTPRDEPVLMGLGGPRTSPPAGTLAPGAPPVVVPRPDPAPEAKLMLERAVNGQLDQQTLELFRQLPEFDQCQQCFRQCEEGFGGSTGFIMRDCRWECLRNCSEHARSLMNQ